MLSTELPLGVWREDSWVPHEPDRRDPFFDWRTVFKSGDVVRLQDGRIGVVEGVWDSSEDSSPPQYEMYVRFERNPGIIDAGIVWCRDCTPAPDDESRAQALGLLD